MDVDWTEKYRPKSLDDVICSIETKSALMKWADSWKSNTVKKKAVILAGAQGVGKTSIAIALANEYGWDIVELNASDKRNYSNIMNIVFMGANYETFTDNGEFISRKDGRFKLILLDEADCLFGDEARGGISAIITTIKSTIQPIILTVNDYYQLTKHKQLKDLCELIKFQKLQKTQIKAKLKYICDSEKIDIAPEALEYIATHSEGDLRAGINDLQSIGKEKRKISIQDVYTLSYRERKNIIFDIMRKIFTATNIKTALDSISVCDESPEDILLWLAENIPFEYREHADLYKGYEILSKAELYFARTIRRQHYGLWRYANILITGGIAVSKTRRYSSTYRYSPPSWLSHMAKTKMLRNIKKSLFKKFSMHCHTSARDIKNIYQYIKIICKNNENFCISLISELEFEKDEIAYILDEKPDSKKLMKLFKE